MTALSRMSYKVEGYRNVDERASSNQQVAAARRLPANSPIADLENVHL
jgi:hypothetical protein